MSEGPPNRMSMRDRRVQAAILIGFVVVVVAVVVFATRDNSPSGSTAGASTAENSTSESVTGPRKPPPLPTVTTTPGQAKPRVMALAKVKTLAGKVKHPVYWAGPMKNAVYEMTYAPGGNFSVRYLAAGSKAGAKTFIATVSTVPFFGAYDSIRQLRVQGGMQKVDTKKGAIAVTSEAYPQSIRLAFPGKDFQIEVISPSVSRVTKLVRSGSIRPIA